MLHLTKVAFGCADHEALRARVEHRSAGGASMEIDTRYRPTRHTELIGGSLFWIIKHKLVARQTILAFEESAEKRCLIRLHGRLVPVRLHPRRAHQGWRYLTEADAPDDFGGGGDLSELPAELLRELADLALV